MVLGLGKFWLGTIFLSLDLEKVEYGLPCTPVVYYLESFLLNPLVPMPLATFGGLGKVLSIW